MAPRFACAVLGGIIVAGCGLLPAKQHKPEPAVARVLPPPTPRPLQRSVLSELREGLSYVWHFKPIRSMLILMGQDLNCVDDELFGLAELVFVFALRNPKIWQHIQERVGSLQGRKWNDVAILKAAECILGMSRSTVAAYRNNSVKLKIRPPRCEHGGYTRAMV